MRRAGGVGCGTIVIALLGAVVFGVDPAQTIAVIGGLDQGQSAPQQQGGDLVDWHHQDEGHDDRTAEIDEG